MNMQQARAIIEHKQTLIDENRYFNVEWDDWWECTKDDFMHDMLSQHGIAVEQIYFSGFWSQGDGACFEGDKDFTPDDPLLKDYPAMQGLIRQGGEVRVRVTQSGRYCHENCTHFDLNVGSFADVTPYTDDEMKLALYDAWDKALDAEVESFDEDVKEDWRDHMRDLYCRLEEEHDYLTSDAQVWEAIKANDLWEGEDWFEELATGGSGEVAA